MYLISTESDVANLLMLKLSFLPNELTSEYSLIGAEDLVKMLHFWCI